MAYGEKNGDVEAVQVKVEENAPQVATEQSEATPNSGTKDAKQSILKELPLHPNKLILLVGGICLCIVSIVALASAQAPIPLFVPTTQFSGDLQLDELDDEVMLWDNSYSDLSSEKSQQLITKLKEKLEKSCKDQGISVDSISVSSIVASEPKTIEKTVITGVPTHGARSIAGRSFLDMYYNNDPKELLNAEVTKKEYKDVSTLSIKYSMDGSPFKNAELFASVIGKWQQIRQNMENDMAKEGARVHINGMEPSNDYMSIVQDGLTNHPDKIAHRTIAESKYHSIGCEMTGAKLYGENMHAMCTSGCVMDKDIYGGKDNIFSYQTAICVAAYYMRIITIAGGRIEVISLGVDSVEAGPSGYHKTKAVEARFPTFTLRQMGEHVLNPDPVFSRSIPLSHQRAPNSQCQCPVHNQAIHVALTFETFNGEQVKFERGLLNRQLEKNKQIIPWLGKKTVSAFKSANIPVDCYMLETIKSPINLFEPKPAETFGAYYYFNICGDVKEIAKAARLVGATSVAQAIYNTLNINGPASDNIQMLSFKYTENAIAEMRS